jgi:hypothetical protein
MVRKEGPTGKCGPHGAKRGNLELDFQMHVSKSNLLDLMQDKVMPSFISKT